MGLFRSYSDKQVKKVSKIADRVMALESEVEKLSDAQLQEKTSYFKEQYKKTGNLDQLLPEAFAVCREAAWRVLHMKPYRVQVIGGIILHQGRIAEMRTGEGKTLVATLPAYLNALTGNGVHIVTVNDYLAKRDSEQMGKVFRFLGLSVGLIIHDIPQEQRAAMYAADITYGTNNEFGFDYLRDNMAADPSGVVQGGHAFAIVDEVDSILIDEARTPLIISGQAGEPNPLYVLADKLAKQLTAKRVKEFDRSEEQDVPDADYLIDEKGKNIVFTNRGIQKIEQVFGLENFADPQNAIVVHHMNQAVRANGIMKRDKDYILTEDGEVVIVDEFTGRLMHGRRYNDGLHQAIEAKEGVKIAPETKTFATITFQNFFRLYGKLSGMTGTALTEEDEFRYIYQLDVVSVPTNKPVIRKDHPDHVYVDQKAKHRAILNQVQECHQKNQPILIGTATIEHSEELSEILTSAGLPHQVLNAKNHKEEARIIAQAGRSGMITIATNMAGRGTDIMLGGNPEYLAMDALHGVGVPDELISAAMSYVDSEDPSIMEVRGQYQSFLEKFEKETSMDAEKVRKVGGLFILGTERHESRRIDNQLRGRAGRQGDPGESRFFLALDDFLLKLFIPDGTLKRFISDSMQEEDSSEPIDSKVLAKAIESAQKRLEGRNFDIRKNVLRYDDILNEQRKEIYAARDRVLHSVDLSKSIQEMRELFIQEMCMRAFQSADVLTQEKLDDFAAFTQDSVIPAEILTMKNPELQKISKKKNFYAELTAYLNKVSEERYAAYQQELGLPPMQHLEKTIFLRTIDRFWMDHLDQMTLMRDGIGLQSYGMNDPVQKYEEYAYNAYQQLVKTIHVNTVYGLYLTAKNAVAQKMQKGEAPEQ